MHAQSSLRSKRFHSSYSARVGAGAKKMEGGGEKRKPSLPYPSPVIPLFSALVPTFATNSRGSACYAGYAQSCCFANLNLSLFCRSRCRLRRCLLKLPTVTCLKTRRQDERVVLRSHPAFHSKRKMFLYVVGQNKVHVHILYMFVLHFLCFLTNI